MRTSSAACRRDAGTATARTCGSRASGSSRSSSTAGRGSCSAHACRNSARSPAVRYGHRTTTWKPPWHSSPAAAERAGTRATRRESMSRCAIALPTAKFAWTTRTAGSATGVAAGMDSMLPARGHPRMSGHRAATVRELAPPPDGEAASDGRVGLPYDRWEACMTAASCSVPGRPCPSVSTASRGTAGRPPTRDLVDGVHDRPPGQLGPAAQARLVPDAGEVVLDRARGDVDLLGDLAVRVAHGDEAQHFELARAELVVEVLRLAARRLLVLTQEVAGEVGCDDRAAAVHGDDGVAQLLAAGALGDVAGGAAGDRGEQRLRLLARRHDQHACVRHLLVEALEGHHAAHLRHVQVEQDHVGLELARHLEALLAVLGLADDPDAGVAGQCGGHALADEREVVDEEDVDLHATTSGAVGSGRGTVRVRRVPAPGAASSVAVPPTAVRRSSTLWRRPQPNGVAAGSNPAPSSAMRTTAAPPVTSARTVARRARACLATLASASRVAPASASTTGCASSPTSGPTTTRICVSATSRRASAATCVSATARSRGAWASSPSTYARSSSAACAATRMSAAASGASA